MEAAITSPVISDSQSQADEAVRLLAKLRATRPLVQAVTNFVSMDIAANALLAIGASPAMIHAPEEAGEFVALSSALVVNIGTISKSFLTGMIAAATAADRIGRPWALDPVGAGATRFRDDAILQLLSLRPAAIRGNASEISSVARIAGLHHEFATPKGVDSAHETGAARASAIALARRFNCVVAATGADDLVTDGERLILLQNGSPMMAKVTAVGCALSAIVAAFLSLTPDAFAATASAIAIYGIVGEMAAERAAGPGSFRVQFIDGLDAVDESDIRLRLLLRLG
jgi:hydroxyethylthiazole kinase